MRKFANQAAKVGEAIRGGVVTIAGKDYDAEFRDVHVEAQLIDGGEIEEGSQVILIRKELMPEKPEASEELLLGERVWWIDTVEGDEEQDAVWTLRCSILN